MIFEHCRYFWSSEGDRPPLRFPLSLLQVCRKWRDITTAAPTLWTDIVILASEENNNLDLNAARLFMERSKSCPLSLTWDNPHRNQDPVIHDILSPASYRLKNLTIEARFRIPDSLLITLEAMQFPTLEYFSFTEWCRSRGPPLPQPSLAAVNLYAPRLHRCVSLNSVVPTGTLSSLARLEIVIFRHDRPFDPAAFFDLLRNTAQNLKRLRLEGLKLPLRGYSLNAPNVRLQALEDLTLQFASEFLLFISAPNLHTLRLCDDSVHSIPSLEGFRAPKLTHLHFSDLLLLDLETNVDLPWQFQELETVVFFECHSTNSSFFLHASSTRNGVPAFPSLSSITLTDPEAFGSVKSMVEGQKAANPGTTTLKKLHLLDWDWTISLDDREWMSTQGIGFSAAPLETP